MGGRPKKLDAKKVAQARSMLKDPEVAETLGVSRATLYAYLKGER